MSIGKSTWILILNWRNGVDTVDCLNSIINDNDSNICGIVVCDNNSGDNSIEDIKHWGEATKHVFTEFLWQKNEFTLVTSAASGADTAQRLKMVLIHTGANLGFAGGNNVGLRYIQKCSDFDFVFLLNNDALLPTGTVAEMVKRCRADTQIGMCGCTVVYNHTPTHVQAYGGASFQPWLGRAKHIGAHAMVSAERNGAAVERQLDYILGAALLITKPCLETIGLMEEAYFLYYEELDWATRAKRAGFTLAYAPEAVVFHKEGGTIGSSSRGGLRSLLSEYYLLHSRLRFTHKFYPQYLSTVFAFALAQSTRTLLRRDWPRLRMQMRALFNRPFVGAQSK